ncbi:MAG: hypothetical protein ACYC6W_11785 [Nitrosotalea sp.]
MGTKPLQNKYLQPIGALIDRTNQQMTVIPWQFGINQGIQTKRIRSSYVYFKKMASLGSSGTLLGTMQAGTTSSAGFTLVDNSNNRVAINDGTVNRIYMGSI